MPTKARVGHAAVSNHEQCVMWHHQRQDAQECVRHLAGVAGLRNNITRRAADTPPCANFKGAP